MKHICETCELGAECVKADAKCNAYMMIEKLTEALK